MSRWLIFQAIGFQALWFIAVLGRNPYSALLLLLLALHFVFSPSAKSDARVLSLALIGIAADALLSLAGVFEFTVLPLWLGLLWCGFVLTLDHCLGWLKKLPTLIVALLGASAGCASYLAGQHFGAVQLPLGLLNSGLILAAMWAVLLPLLIKLDQWLRYSSC